MLDEIHFITPLLLFLDHLSEIAWYLWLVRGATQGRKKLHVVLTHLFNMGLMLLGAAILGAISGKWEIALEVFATI
jgi:small neutral amino acid transporter SnatA (MarC family)